MPRWPRAGSISDPLLPPKVAADRAPGPGLQRDGNFADSRMASENQSRGRARKPVNSVQGHRRAR
jgi:hypothetical protein